VQRGPRSKKNKFGVPSLPDIKKGKIGAAAGEDMKKGHSPAREEKPDDP